MYLYYTKGETMKKKIQERELVSLIAEAAHKVISESIDGGEQDLNSVLYSFDYTVDKLKRFGNWLLKVKETIARLIPGFIEKLAEYGMILDGISYSLTDGGIVLSYKNYQIDTTKIRRDVLDDYAGEENALVDYLMNEAASSYEHELGTATVKSIDSFHWRKEIEFGLLEDFNPELISKTLPDV